MTQVSYTRPGTPAKPIKLTPAMYANVFGSTKSKYKKGQILGAGEGPYKGADINKAPGYSKLKKSLKKKGFTSNVSK